ncbi:MAG: ATP-binding protein [Acidimicrobiales bacterium]
MATDDRAVDEFAELFRRFLERMAAPATTTPSLAERLRDHLQVDPIGLSAISESFEVWDHANVQAALDAYISQPGAEAQLVGVLGGQKRMFGVGLSDLLVTRTLSVAGMAGGGSQAGPVDYVNMASGPGRTLACIQFGVVLVNGPHGKLAALVRVSDERSGPANHKVTIEVIAPDPANARAFLARLRELMTEHNVYRGQVVTLSRRQPPYGAISVEFRPRPAVSRDEIVLAGGVLERIEAHAIGIAEEQVRLRAAGRHLKRGLLLHGPPGTGKTLTVRYLARRMEKATVLVLSGPALGLIGPSCALARTLTPALVVLEDVDLVAEERTMPGMGRNPVLFELLNEMEGMAEDADVTFVLTTNRPDILEPALAARPGRVDLAVEIALPDTDGRRKLFELYGAGLGLPQDDLGDVIVRTDGVSPAFIKELLRKATLRAATRSVEGALQVSVADVDAALDDFLSETGALTRRLLGGATDRPPATTLASMNWLPGAPPAGPAAAGGQRR